MVKLEMIFHKTGYARVPKILNITGLLKTKYLHVADTWEAEERNRSPLQLSHCFGEVERFRSEVEVKSVLQMIGYLEARFKEKKRIENNRIVDSSSSAKKYAELRRSLQAFTKEKYGEAFSAYFFTDITEQFLPDFAFWIKEQGIRNGNRGGLTQKLRCLRAVCNYARKQEMYGVNMDAFLCPGDDVKRPETPLSRGGNGGQQPSDHLQILL